MAAYKQTHSHKQEHRQSLEAIQTQKQVMKMSPKDLETFEAEEDYNDQIEENDLINDDAEIFDYDTDQNLDDYAESIDSISNDTTEFEREGDYESPVLELNDYHIITIMKSDKNKYNCVYDPINVDAMKFTNKDMRQAVNKRVVFLASLAKWMNEKQQKFLAHPKPENFFYGPGDTKNLTQRELLKQVYQDPEDIDQISEGDFSSLKDQIWFIWDDKNMPLQEIFSKEFIKG